MKSARFGMAAITVGLAVALGAFAYLLDHMRASARVTPGLGDAAEPEREQALAVPASGADEDEREPVPVTQPEDPSPAGALVVHLVGEDGKPLPGRDVLAYRGDELLRAGRTDGKGLARLIPFDGPAALAVEFNGLELVRAALPEGRGRHELVVPRGQGVAGIVLVDGQPREGVELALTDGADDWLAHWIQSGLERNGLRERRSGRYATTGADGRFRFDWLTPEWSGVLRLSETGFCFADGVRRIELACPDEELVLELDRLAAPSEPVIRGRVVFDGRPVPGAQLEFRMQAAMKGSGSRAWRGDELGIDSVGTSGAHACDEQGCFALHSPGGELQELHLELFGPDLGARTLELRGAEIRADLGDVELQPTRTLAFVARSESGQPIAGVRGRPLGDLRIAANPASWQGQFQSRLRCSEPTDAEGKGLLRWLEPEQSVRFSALGYAAADVASPPGRDALLEVVLARSATVQVAVRDRAGRLPAGLRVRLQAPGAPFTWSKGYYPEGDEETPEAKHWCRAGGPYTGQFPLDARGRTWIDALRPGEPFDLAAVDEYGSVAAEARGLVLARGEWRRVELTVETEPRTLLVVVHDTLGHPLSGAWLRVQPAARPQPSSWSLRTDRAGMGRTEPLYAEDVTVRVTRAGFEPRTVEHVAVPREGATLEVRLAHEWWAW